MPPRGNVFREFRLILQGIAWAFRLFLQGPGAWWMGQMAGLEDSSEAMSKRLGLNKGRLTSLIRLCYLAPEIVGALLAGHPIALTPTSLLRLSKNLPHDWKEQRRFLGFAG